MRTSFVIVSISFCYVQCAKILGVFPIPSISHQVVYQSVWRELSLRGHQVTVFTPDPLKNESLTNLTEIDLSSTYDIIRRIDIAKLMAKDNSVTKSTLWLLDFIEEVTIEHFKMGEILFKSATTEFDLIIVETLHPLVYSLGCRFRVPIVAISSFGVLLQTHDAVGNPTHPVLSPDIFANIVGQMGLYQKMSSVLHNLWYRIVYYWLLMPRYDKIAKRFWGDHCPYLGDLERNVDLVLVNTNSILHPVRANVPNIIEMGQMHITIKKSLPQDLQEYLDVSRQGVIYFSLGSNVKSANLSVTTRKIIIETLSELPYNVLWKWETDYLPDKPVNVMTRKWFPQQDLLGHKHVKAFVSQGGLQSMEEAVSNSVPVVGMPFFGDQSLNVMKMVQMGIGRSIDHMTMTKETLKEVIIEVAENKKYQNRVKELKDLFRDQPMTGLEKTVWWIEYVIRHKGAKHLRSPAADMTWFEYYLVDVILTVLFGTFAFTYLIIFCLKMLTKYVRWKNVKIKTG